MKLEILHQSASKASTQKRYIRTQRCPVCNGEMGDMPGSRDAVCTNCGYKDPCCE